MSGWSVGRGQLRCRSHRLPSSVRHALVVGHWCLSAQPTRPSPRQQGQLLAKVATVKRCWQQPPRAQRGMRRPATAHTAPRCARQRRWRTRSTPARPWLVWCHCTHAVLFPRCAVSRSRFHRGEQAKWFCFVRAVLLCVHEVGTYANERTARRCQHWRAEARGYSGR